jgi:hypothetical protein
MSRARLPRKEARSENEPQWTHVGERTRTTRRASLRGCVGAGGRWWACAPCTTWHRTCYFELRWPKRGASQVPAFTTENRALVKARRPGVSVRTTATGTTALRRSYDPKAVVPHVPTCVFECSIHDCVTVHSPCPCSNMLLLSVLRCGWWTPGDAAQESVALD